MDDRLSIKRTVCALVRYATVQEWCTRCSIVKASGPRKRFGMAIARSGVEGGAVIRFLLAKTTAAAAKPTDRGVS